MRNHERHYQPTVIERHEQEQKPTPMLAVTMMPDHEPVMEKVQADVREPVMVKSQPEETEEESRPVKNEAQPPRTVCENESLEAIKSCYAASGR